MMFCAINHKVFNMWSYNFYDMMLCQKKTGMSYDKVKFLLAILRPTSELSLSSPHKKKIDNTI